MNRDAGEEDPPHRALLLRAYAAYNAQDLDALLDCVSDDVDWPDGERRLRGRDAVRSYWTEQWARVRVHDDPVALEDEGGGWTAVRLNQVVRSLDGALVSRGRFVHRARVVDGRVTCLHIERVPAR